MARLIRPVTFIWTEDGRMAPLPRFRRMCDEQFVVGEEYPLALLEARSRASHNHYFACIHEAWVNLPEEVAQEFDNEDHLRKWALCETGFCTKKIFDCDSDEHAMNMTAFMRTVGLSFIEIRGSKVIVKEAESQAVHLMGKQRFQESKDAVLTKIATLLDVTPRQLRREGEKHFPEPKRHRALPAPDRGES